MSRNPRCLYDNSFQAFLHDTEMSVLGVQHNNYHGDTRTATTEAWKEEIAIMREVVSSFEREGHIVFEYDIPRLGKRIDVVLLLKGIIFCIEFKVGETQKLEPDVDQVLDYALDLKNFHQFSQEKIIVPVLVPTQYKKTTTMVQRKDRLSGSLTRGAVPDAENRDLNVQEKEAGGGDRRNNRVLRENGPSGDQQLQTRRHGCAEAEGTGSEGWREADTDV